MKIEEYLKVLHVFENLKNNTRHSYTSSGRQESVAEHSYRLAVMAYFLKDEFPELDIQKLILMCLLHDMGEAFTGDIPCFEKNEEHEEVEREQVNAFLTTLPDVYRKELKALFEEMEALDTVESRLCKALDKLEAIIQHNESDISTWLPLEYDLQLTHGLKESAWFEYTKALRKICEQITKEKIEKQ